MFVLFDSCWDPSPHLGPQHPPIPGVHNSGWVQSPGAAALADANQYPRLKEYVQGVLGAFRKDDRILAWDVWNEPGADNLGSYPKVELKDKTARVIALLERPKGATLKELMRATGWQTHSVRGLISGQLKKKLKLKVRSFKREGERVYSIKPR